nr:pollen receptor-like kinase 4 [Tanacetum cinerariifolium]
ISDHSMKSKNPSRIRYSGSGPGKGTTITRKESRALNANRKRRFNQRKLVSEIDDCAGRIVRDDSQTFITKGGCVVRECAVFDGRTWKKQPDLLKEDIISKTTEHSDFKSTCPLLARAIKTQLASHHRTRQYILHKHYLKYPTKEEAMTHPPNGVKVAEWVLLCDRFASEEFQKISATNKQNRACNEVPPTVGTKSVARRIHMPYKKSELFIEALHCMAISRICTGRDDIRHMRVVKTKSDRNMLQRLIDMDTLAELPGLRTLSFTNNSFQGTIPSVSKIGMSRGIYLSHNSFSGDIKDDLFSGLRWMRRVEL